MKFFAVVVGLLVACAASPVRAQQNADDQYIAIYNLIQQGDELQAANQIRLALDSYKQAQGELQKLQTAFPDWDPKIVTFRLDYLAERISDLTARLPAENQGVTATNQAANPVPPPTPENTAEIQLNALRIQSEGLLAENQLLQAKLKEALRAQPAAADPRALAEAQAQVLSLMKENDLLRASLTTGTTGGAKPDELSKLRQALADSDKKLAEQTRRVDKLAQENQSLESSASVSALEKAALEKRLRQRQTAAPAPAKSSDSAELKTLRARLAVDEAQAVPYKPEELALLKSSAPTPVVKAGGREKSVSELPGGSATLAAEAQSYFSAGNYEMAEADYRRILQRDPTNAVVLGNLAAIELQEDKLGDADTHLTAALAQHPDDAFNLSTYGFLKFRQQKFDEALDALSRAAKLDPTNPQIQNYLGVTLSHKGLRAQAETALRKAIELDPNYAAAHNNLAVIYISEKPPLAELARWHYQKALQLGQPRNPDLEKTLADMGAPVAP